MHESCPWLVPNLSEIVSANKTKINWRRRVILILIGDNEEECKQKTANTITNKQIKNQQATNEEKLGFYSRCCVLRSCFITKEPQHQVEALGAYMRGRTLVNELERCSSALNCRCRSCNSTLPPVNSSTEATTMKQNMLRHLRLYTRTHYGISLDVYFPR